jgi:hypothetical protein
MTTLAPSEVVDATNPRLTTHIAVRGYLTEPMSLEFQIFDRTGASPAQIFPSTEGDRATVNLTTDVVSPGEYAATWTVPNDAADGRYEVRWFTTIETGDAEKRWSRFFDVRADVTALEDRPAYALVSDVRAEGTYTTVSDERILEAILSASEMIDTWTGRSFVPIAKTIHVSGLHQRILPLGEPICAINDVYFGDDTLGISRSAYSIFARHLTERLRDPDDRESPALEFGSTNSYQDELSSELSSNVFTSSRRFYNGVQNVRISGVFGYTEFDGSPVGRTPRAVRRATMLLALREMFPQSSAQSWQAQNEAFITEKRTREQSIKFGGGTSGSGKGGVIGPTGDLEIDRLVMSVMPALRGTGC